MSPYLLRPRPFGIVSHLIYLQHTPTTHSTLDKNTYQVSNRSRAATGDALLDALLLHVNILSILKVAVSDFSLAVNVIQASCTYSNSVGKRFKISRAKSPEQKGHNVFVD